MTEVGIDAKAVSIFSDYPRVVSGEVVPVQLMKQIAGLDAYKLSIEDEKKGLETTRVPINDQVTVDLVQRTEAISMITEEGSQMIPRTETLFLISFTKDQERLRTHKIEKSTRAGFVADFYSMPGTYEIGAYVARFGSHSPQDEILGAYEHLVGEVKKIPKGTQDPIAYAGTVLSVASSEGKQEYDSYMEKRRQEEERLKKANG